MTKNEFLRLYNNSFKIHDCMFRVKDENLIITENIITRILEITAANKSKSFLLDITDYKTETVKKLFEMLKNAGFCGAILEKRDLIDFHLKESCNVEINLENSYILFEMETNAN